MYVDPTGRIFGIDDLLIVGIGALIGGLVQGITTGNWSFGNIAEGIFKGLALSASVIGVSAIATGIQTAVVGGGELGTVGNFGAGVLFNGISTEASAFAAAAAVPAAIGLFNPNASSFEKDFARGYLIAGTIGNATRTAVGIVGYEFGIPPGGFDLSGVGPFSSGTGYLWAPGSGLFASVISHSGGLTGLSLVPLLK